MKSEEENYSPKKIASMEKNDIFSLEYSQRTDNSIDDNVLYCFLMRNSPKKRIPV